MARGSLWLVVCRRCCSVQCGRFSGMIIVRSFTSSCLRRYEIVHPLVLLNISRFCFCSRFAIFRVQAYDACAVTKEYV